MATSWTTVTKTNAGTAEIDFIFSDGSTDFLFSDGSTDFVFVEATSSISWSADSKTTTSWSAISKS